MWDTGSSDETRSGALRRENEALRQSLSNAENLLHHLTSLPEDASVQYLRHLRSGGYSARESIIRDSSFDSADSVDAYSPGETLSSTQPIAGGFKDSKSPELAPEVPRSTPRSEFSSGKDILPAVQPSGLGYRVPSFDLIVNRSAAPPLRVSGGLQRAGE